MNCFYEIIENNISEVCEKQQFLETNFDYVESELDIFEDCGDNTDQKIDEINQIKETLDYDIKNVSVYKILNKDLIYEDEVNAHHDTSKKPRSESNNGSRTLLPCMKIKTDSGHGRSKSTNTKYDTKNQKASRPQKRVSHIPRLKSLMQQSKFISSESSLSLKNISKGVSGDCENTSPHSHGHRWDKDTSIVL